LMRTASLWASMAVEDPNIIARQGAGTAPSAALATAATEGLHEERTALRIDV